MSDEDSLRFGLENVLDGEFAGWRVCAADPFEQRAGPFYETTDAAGCAVIAFRAEPRHMNGAGFIHGGCLLTFADSALFTIARDAMEGAHGVTMTLSGDFLSSVSPGQRVEARGEVTRAGHKTVFVRGLVTADETPALSFNGIIRKVSAR